MTTVIAPSDASGTGPYPTGQTTGVTRKEELNAIDLLEDEESAVFTDGGSVQVCSPPLFFDRMC